MAVDIVMPQMGESIFEGTITKWLKKPGDKVERDEPLFEISTDKVDAEIPAPAAGVLKEIKVGEGQTVPIQTIVGVIDADGAGAGSAAVPLEKAAAAAPPKKTDGARPAAGAQSSATQSEPKAQPPSGSSPAPQQAPARSASPAPAVSPAQPAGASQRSAPAVAAGPATPPRRPGERIHSSPLVRRLAKEHGVDLAAVAGSGAGGRISKKDILAVIEGGSEPHSGESATSDLQEAFEGDGSAPVSARQTSQPEDARQASGDQARGGQAEVSPALTGQAPAGQPPSQGQGGQSRITLENAVPRERIYFGRYDVQPMSVMRTRIAEHMVASKRVSAHVYSVDEVDMTKVVSLRNRSKAEFEKRHETKLTFMPFFVKATVEGLRAFPTLNASADGTNVILHREINIGIAVALDWGLIVPVIKNADEKNLLGIQRTMNDLAERARSKKLKPEEVQEGTFSITNPGVFGGLFGLPVINQPQVGILGLGSIEKRPVVVEDAIAIRSMCYLSLSYDHRVVDGATAHQFMHKVKETLENWSEPVL